MELSIQEEMPSGPEEVAARSAGCRYVAET